MRPGAHRHPLRRHPLVQRHRADLPHARPSSEDRIHSGDHRPLSASARTSPRRSSTSPTCRPASRQTAGTEGLLSLVNLFSGGALLQLSIFALGVMPYITATIIVQLLRVVIPHFETLYKEGQAGQARLTQYTRYLTIALGAAAVHDAGHGRPQRPAVRHHRHPRVRAAAHQRRVVGAAAHDHHDDRRHRPHHVVRRARHRARHRQRHVAPDLHLDRRGASPASMWAIWQSQGLRGLPPRARASASLVVALVVFVEQSQRRIPVQYAKRMVGRRTYGGNNTYIPIKVNMAGVVPVIFASSLLYIPALIAQFNQPQPGETAAAVGRLDHATTSPRAITRSTCSLYFLLIVGFTYFYVAITFNPVEVADNMKKYGGFIPGIRAGRPTAEYLDYVLTRITLPGSLYLGFDRPAAADRPRRGRRQPELPVRRRLDPDHRRCRSRDGQADRRAAAAAPLRRTPAMTGQRPTAAAHGS